MKRFTGHKESWGEFVDVKINASSLLLEEINKKPPGRVWISGVCDPYQPVEWHYELTRNCLEILVRYDWPVTIQTKSSLVLRDTDLFRRSDKIEVGLSVTTANDQIRRLFEPNTSPIEERIKALEKLHLAGIKTYAMIAPILPGVEDLADVLENKVDYVLIDRMNYHYGDWVYRRHSLEDAMSDEFFSLKAKQLASAFEKEGVDCRVLF